MKNKSSKKNMSIIAQVKGKGHAIKSLMSSKLSFSIMSKSNKRKALNNAIANRIQQLYMEEINDIDKFTND